MFKFEKKLSNLNNKGISDEKKILLDDLNPDYNRGLMVARNPTSAADLIYKLISYFSHKNFNLFIHSSHVYFIPREDIEIPDGFQN